MELHQAYHRELAAAHHADLLRDAQLAMSARVKQDREDKEDTIEAVAPAPARSWRQRVLRPATHRV